MATFLCAWEMGGGLGHLMRLRPIAEQLVQLNHRVVFAVQNLPRSRFLIEAGFECVQAPVLKPLSGVSPPNSMAQILARRGYSDVNKLEGMVHEWIKIYRRIKPDLVLADYAPTAILSARKGQIPVAVVGSGFSFPPRDRWACNLRPWLVDKSLRDIEKQIILNVNQVAKSQGLAGINRTADLFYGDNNFIYDLQETDIYKRSQCRYIIKKYEPNGFPVPKWKSKNKIKVAGYLKKGFKENPRIISALSKMDVEAHIVVPDMQSDVQPNADNITLYREPIDLSALITGSNAVLFHAGSTLKEVVLKGKVSLLAPLQLEQFHYAQRMEKNGFGEIINFKLSDLSSQFKEVLNNQDYISNVEAVKEKYSKSGNWCSSHDITREISSLALNKV